MSADSWGPSPDAGPVLEAAAGLGPYFTWEPWDADAAWRPLAELFDPAVIAERVAVARQTLIRMTGLGPGDIAERPVASITFLGYASRLLSPLLAAAAIGDALPIPSSDRMWWRPVDGGPLPIAADGLTAADCARSAAADVAEVLTGTAIRALAGPLLDVFCRGFSLPPELMWGNVASSLGGAAGMIADQSPRHAARAAEVVTAALRLAPLAGTATLERPDPGRDRWFLVRRNCCLYYRIPGGGTCGDCVLTPDDVRRRHWQSVLSR